MQRFFDVFISGIAVVLFSPILVSIIMVLRFTGEKEVFFQQVRIGKNQNPFQLLKFATMLKNSETMGAGTVTIEDDPRVLPIGKFLRKTKLNEIPQLFNILKGDMSIIGPRPLHKKQFSFYSPADQVVISSIMPGLSGVGSICFRDEEKILKSSDDPDAVYKQKIAPKKAMLEKWYVKNNTIALYFKLIVLTIVAVAIPRLEMIKFFKDLDGNM